MAGLVLAIHVLLMASPQGVDARDKPGHDGGESQQLMPPLRDLHVLKIARLVVDTDLGRSDPTGELGRLKLWLH
jgi:hypothetical protein